MLHAACCAVASCTATESHELAGGTWQQAVRIQHVPRATVHQAHAVLPDRAPRMRAFPEVQGLPQAAVLRCASVVLAHVTLGTLQSPLLVRTTLQHPLKNNRITSIQASLLDC